MAVAPRRGHAVGTLRGRGARRRRRATGATGAAAAPGSAGLQSGPEGSYEALRGEFDQRKLQAFFSQRPWEVTRRFTRFAVVGARLARRWRAQDTVPPAERTRDALLREAVASLGPVFVKCGQTLAQRPDLVGEEAADALKLLQSQAEPFDDAEAYRIVREDLQWDGPLAPGMLGGEDGEHALFAEFGPSPVASASLGQVYKARTWDGRSVAVKVQRPGALRLVARDMYVLRLALGTLQNTWLRRRRRVEGEPPPTDLRPIADEVGEGVFRELDYWQEAENARVFAEQHAFLGFVRAPQCYPEYTGPPGCARVLSMEWIEGRPISDLPHDAQLRMVNMAVEAAVAQLIRTGFVHADPHEGNMLLTPDGNLAFLDFGLMARVDPKNMEAFASGICHMLAGDWLSLAYDFRDIGIAPPERFLKSDPETGAAVEISAEEFAEGIRGAMLSQEDGTSRFGALATGLGSVSNQYRFLCPPFIILLCRTFLTLEGIAAKVDPTFNIYVASLPYAIRRALSPETSKGKDTLRDALLTNGGEFRWDRFEEVLEQAQTLAAGPVDASPAERDAAVPVPEAAPPPGAEAAADSVPGGAGGMETVKELLVAPEGATLRRVFRRADSVALAMHLASAKARELRRSGSQQLASLLLTYASAQRRFAERTASRTREQRWQAAVLRVIVLGHLRQLWMSGPRGFLALASLVCVGIAVVARAAASAAVSWCRERLGAVRKWRSLE